MVELGYQRISTPPSFLLDSKDWQLLLVLQGPPLEHWLSWNLDRATHLWGLEHSRSPSKVVEQFGTPP